VLGGEDARQLERVVELVCEVLGPDVLGVYLFGSAVLGGLRPESDLDLLAVSARPTTLDEKRRVVERLLSISGRRTPEGRWRRVELTSSWRRRCGRGASRRASTSSTATGCAAPSSAGRWSRGRRTRIRISPCS
jgi:predicted nucleotidyltransferase